MNPDHLLEQADQLLTRPDRGAPRQANKRRAISAAYYALFHALARLVANELIGSAQRHTPRYALIYRSLEHGRLKSLCSDLLRPALPAKYAPFTPQGGFGADVARVAKAMVDLQDLRHRADYDPGFRINTGPAATVVEQARGAVGRIARWTAEEKQLFSALAVFEPRR